MKDQKGAALIVVLSMLTASLMLGLTSMQSSQIDERLAGNYKASAQAQMAAEEAASEMFYMINENELSPGDAEELVEDFGWVEFSNFASGRSECQADNNDRLSCFLNIPPSGRFGEEPGDYIITMGAVDGAAIAVSPPLFVELMNSEGGGGRPVLGVDTCVGVSISGGGVLDSYDSAKGDYGQNGNMHGTEAIATSQVQTEGDAIELGGGGIIYGDIVTPGSVKVKNADVYGNIKSNHSVVLSGGSGHEVSGDVEAGSKVEFANTNTVGGDVRAVSSVDFIGGGRSPDLVSGVVESPNINVTNDKNKDYNRSKLIYSSPVFSSVDHVGSPDECESLGFSDPSNPGEVSDSDPIYQLENQSVNVSNAPSFGGGKEYHLTSEGLMQYTPSDPDPWKRLGNSAKQVEFLGRSVSAVGFDGFHVSGGVPLTVGAPGEPVDMVLYVDGDGRVNGGASVTISEGSTLTIVTTGKFEVNGGGELSVSEGRPSRELSDGSVVPILSLYSSYDQRDSGGAPGVKITGGGAFYGQIVAPFSELSVISNSGVDFFGAANAYKASIDGGGGFHVDEQLLKNRHAGGDASSQDNAFEINSWR